MSTKTFYPGTHASPAVLYDPGAGHAYGYGNIIQLANGDLLRIGRYDNSSLKIYKSTDLGASWTPLSTIDVTPTYTMIAGSLWLRSNGDVWVFYSERIITDDEYYYSYSRVSVDSGASWAAANTILPGYDGQDHLSAQHTPPILMSNGKLALPVSFIKSDLSLQRSVLAVYNFDTSTWTGYEVASDPTYQYNEWSLIETDTAGHLVGILRSEKSQVGYFYRVTSNDYGATWSAPVQNYLTGNTSAGAVQDTPHLIKVNSRIYMSTWYRRYYVDASHPVDARVVASDDWGVTWHSDLILNQTQEFANSHGNASTLLQLSDGSFMQSWDMSLATWTDHAATYIVKYTWGLDSSTGRYVPAPSTTWADLHDGAGNGGYTGLEIFDYISRIDQYVTANKWSDLERGLFTFLIDLPDGAVITGAVFSLYGMAKANPSFSPDVNIYNAPLTSETDLIDANYNHCGTTPYCDTPITYAGFSLTGYNDFTLNAAGLAAIPTKGVFKLCTRNAQYDVPNTAPTHTGITAVNYLKAISVEQGLATAPKLTIEYNSPPAVTTQYASDISDITATGNGNITAEGLDTPDERGFEWGLFPGGPYPNSVTELGSFTTGAYSLSLGTDLPPDTTIYYRAKARNSQGWGYGSERSFDTLAPQVSTMDATNIESDAATGNGYCDVEFIEYGFEWGLVDGGPFSLQLTGLPVNTVIYYRAQVDISGTGWVYGSQVSFTTKTDVPELITDPPSDITETSLTAHGEITSTGGDVSCDEVGFVYDTASHADPGNVAPGASGYPSHELVSGTYGVGAFSLDWGGLVGNQIYYTRAFTHNSYGYAYGEEVIFLTNPNVEILYPTGMSSLGIRFDSSPGGGYPHPHGGTIAHYILVRSNDAKWNSGGTWGYISGNFVYEYNYYNDNYYTDFYFLSNPINQTEGFVKLKWKARALRTAYPYGKYKRELWTHGAQYTGAEIACSTGTGLRCEIFYTNPATGAPWTLAEANDLIAGISLGQEGSFGYAACGYLAVFAIRANAQVRTDGATDLGGTNKRLYGKVMEDEAETSTVHFEWGADASYGNTTADQTKAKGDTFTADIDIGVLPSIHFRTVITTECGETFYGADATYPSTPTGIKGNLASKLAGGGFI
jgi:hypothetical protein